MKNILFSYLIFCTTILIGQEMNLSIIPSPQKIILPEISTQVAFGKAITIESNDLTNPKIKICVGLLTDDLNEQFELEINNSGKNLDRIRLDIVEKFFIFG